jgi:hypothetical protein
VDYPSDLVVLENMVASSRIVFGEQFIQKNFTFDKEKLFELRAMPRKELTVELTKMMDEYVVFGKPNTDTVNNYIISCYQNKTQSFCQGNKLVINKDRYKEMISLLVTDILNDSKIDIFIHKIYLKKIISPMKFQHRVHETIYIDIN